jgi:hypothetical protein
MLIGLVHYFVVFKKKGSLEKISQQEISQFMKRKKNHNYPNFTALISIASFVEFLFMMNFVATHFLGKASTYLKMEILSPPRNVGFKDGRFIQRKQIEQKYFNEFIDQNLSL